MLADADKRAENVREKAEIFRSQEFPNTADALSKVAKYIETGRNVDVSEITDIFRVFAKEYGTGGRDFQALYDFISGTIADSIISMQDKFRDKLMELEPFFGSLTQASRIMERVATLILAKQSTEEEKYYATCVIYGMDVEGQFDETCRILYALYRISQGKDTRFADAWEHKIWDLRAELNGLSNGKSEILFLGWMDNHLRNAISHMKFNYDSSSKKMHFEDTFPGKKPWRLDLSLTDFQHLARLVSDVTFLFLHVMMILGARDMVVSADPFEKGLTN